VTIRHTRDEFHLNMEGNLPTWLILPILTCLRTIPLSQVPNIIKE
jgi:hypothetical protein